MDVLTIQVGADLSGEGVITLVRMLSRKRDSTLWIQNAWQVPRRAREGIRFEFRRSRLRERLLVLEEGGSSMEVAFGHLGQEVEQAST